MIIIIITIIIIIIFITTIIIIVIITIIATSRMKCAAWSLLADFRHLRGQLAQGFLSEKQGSSSAYGLTKV